MRMAAAVVAWLGVLALALAVVERLFGFQLIGLMAASFLNGAMTFFLLALVIMVYDKCYGAPTTPQKN